MNDSNVKEELKSGPKEINMFNSSLPPKIKIQKGDISCSDVFCDDDQNKKQKSNKPCLKRIWDENECIYAFRLTCFGLCCTKCIPPL